MSEIGGEVTLEEVGLFADVINLFANEVTTSDGSIGGYQAVERQIVEQAKQIIEGRIDYGFSNNYTFGDVFDLLVFNGRYSLGESTVEGSFDGDVRVERQNDVNYLVINGVMTYDFSDKFADPNSQVESLMEEEDLSREEAEAVTADSADKYGTPYGIIGQWKTKLNATTVITDKELEEASE